MVPKTMFAPLLLAAAASAQIAVPGYLQDFYNKVKGERTCPNKLAGGFQRSSCDDPKQVGYCQDPDTQVIYLHTAHGHLADMDIDCDGTNRRGQSDYDDMCPPSSDTQSETSGDDALQQYGINLKHLDATRIPYAVFGNSNDNNVNGNIDPNYKTFSPQDHGVQMLSVMAVMCNGKLVFGVWGDENGADAGCSLTGEASVSLGRLCYGDSINGNAGPDDDEILYIAFPGSVEDTVPKDVADWHAHDYHDFEQSITDFGNNLLKKTFNQ